MDWRKNIRFVAVASVMASLVGVGHAASGGVLVDTNPPQIPGVMPGKVMPAHIPLENGFPQPTVHTGVAHDVNENYTARWTRADARQIKAMSNPNVADGQNSMPASLTMPAISSDFPVTNDQVWIWDTWPLTDASGNQYSYNGWDVIFCLTFPRNTGLSFDERHSHARIGYFYRRSGIPASQRPQNGGWIYGGLVFPEGASAAVYAGQNFTNNAQWSGSMRMFKANSNQITAFYTDMAFNLSNGLYNTPIPKGANVTPPKAIITKADGQIHSDSTHVWFTGFDKHIPLLQPDGVYYQTGEQNQYFSFRDPYTFTDPAHPGQTFMVFAGNSSGVRGETPCDAADLGYRDGDKYAETVSDVNGSGSIFQRANIGLAVATKADLSEWKFLPPLVSANCVNDQLERPQMSIQDGIYYLMTISHRTTFSSGIDGPDGEYAFVGQGIRSDFIPLNAGSGLLLGNPTDLNTAAGADFLLNPQQNPNTFQSYSHYYMPNGLVTSFIDAIGDKRGGDLAPTVQLELHGVWSELNAAYGNNGLGAYGDITPNRFILDWKNAALDASK
ncbi:glycoside hydrolase family 68 protein [Neokomagataea sp. TBRC 2177]|uniref:Glycoside hydrolase family 68 protein n=1 Tax=Neokomagataea anthophila TaxID=2826925 RepID=A0ABS5E5Q7_9PROT|nr:glycoside hydrolase family 68 protein [Neokomagataea anthophila]